MTAVLNIERTYSDPSKTSHPFYVVRKWEASTGEVIATTPGTAYSSTSVASDVLMVIGGTYESDKWQTKLSAMTDLAPGWNGYEAPSPSGAAIVTAKGFLTHLLNMKQAPSRVAPSAEGGVGVTRKSGNRRVYVEFFNDGKVYALFSDNETPPRSREITVGYQGFRGLATEIKDYLDA